MTKNARRTNPRNLESDQIQRWKAEVAKHRRQRRQQRGERRQLVDLRPGMVRRAPPEAEQTGQNGTNFSYAQVT